MVRVIRDTGITDLIITRDVSATAEHLVVFVARCYTQVRPIYHHAVSVRPSVCVFVHHVRGFSQNE